jgi:predicted membrane channel-forming protein YqfA (hemolysin III family)
VFRKRPSRSVQQFQEEIMNTIIYIVGLVVIIGVILSFFGLR